MCNYDDNEVRDENDNVVSPYNDDYESYKYDNDNRNDPLSDDFVRDDI